MGTVSLDPWAAETPGSFLYLYSHLSAVPPDFFLLKVSEGFDPQLVLACPCVRVSPRGSPGGAEKDVAVGKGRRLGVRLWGCESPWSLGNNPADRDISILLATGTF